MRENRTPGSVQGAPGNRRSYCDGRAPIRRGIGLKTITLSGVLLCLLLVCNMVSGSGQNTFTGIFKADSRPREMAYLGMTQTGDIVSGLLIVVTPDGDGSTTSSNLPLRGTTDGDAITLTADRFFKDLVINGRKEGKTIVLMFPTDSGNISTMSFMPTTDKDYNLLLNRWQEELAEIHEEKEELTKLANAVYDAINVVKSTGIRTNLADIKYALEDERLALHDLEIDLAELKHNASLRPMTCFQANSIVGHDYNSRMGYSYSSRLGYAHDKFMSRLKELEERISNAEPLATIIREGAHALDQAIEESKHPLPKLKFMPGDEKQILEQYQVLVASARNELPVLKGTHSDILSKAKGFMREGESILKKTQASVRCN